MDSRSIGFPVSLDVPTTPPVVFQTLSDLDDWMKKESELWAWVPQFWKGKSAEEDTVPSGTHADLVSASEALEHLKEATQDRDKDEAERQIKQVLGLIRAAYADPRAVVPGSPAHGVMRAAAVYGTAAVMGAYCGMFDRKGRVPFNQAVEFTIGWTRGFLFNGGLGDAPQKAMMRAEYATAEAIRFTSDAKAEIEATKKDVEEHQIAIAGLANEAKVKVTVAMNEMERVKSDAGELDLSLNKLARHLDKELTEKVTAHVEASRAELKAAIEGIQKANREEMALKAPIAYWTSQRTTCYSRAALGFAACLVIGGLMAWWGSELFSKAQAAYENVLPKPVSAPADAPAVDHSHWWRVGEILFYTTLGLWLLRLLVRFTLSQTHMGLDAGFRVVMTKAYIAMIQEKHIDGAESRELVLRSLFRPPATGMIRDDAMPPTPMGELNNRISGA